MANPKRRHSNTRTNLRRAHDALKPVCTALCSNCGAPRLSHRVCAKCGYYRGKPVISIKVKEDKKKK